jgi:YesN/AraC family two-component response regulator
VNKTKIRILFVDDEAGIRMTLPAILEMHGYEVKAAATVQEALEIIQREKFDVMLSDLNNEGPADGFIVVNAMRRLQREAVTFILTGYPNFTTALEAIRQQVDEYLVKPADIDKLLQEIKDKLARRHPHQPREVLRAAEVLTEKQGEILSRWLEEWKRDPKLSRFQLTKNEMLNQLPELLKQLVSHPPETAPISKQVAQVAIAHAVRRREQGFTQALLVREVRIFRVVLGEVLQENLLRIDLSYLVYDMIEISQNLDQLLEEGVAAFVDGSLELKTTA